MTKQVGMVTGNQFGYLYIEGMPYNPAKVKRFLTKGAGIKIQDLVIFEAEDNGDIPVLSYIKNAIYAEGKEAAMVKHYVRTSELQRAKASQFLDVSDAIKKDLAMEGVVITGEGVFLTPPEDDIPKERVRGELFIPEAILDSLMPEQKRTISILLQSSLKLSGDINMINASSNEQIDMDRIKADALDLTYWIDANSTEILSSAKEYIERKNKAAQKEPVF